MRKARTRRSNSMDSNHTSFWRSMPGILTGIAAVLAGVTGLIVALQAASSGAGGSGQGDHTQKASPGPGSSGPGSAGSTVTDGCVHYGPGDLRINDLGTEWTLTAGDRTLLRLDNRADAALAVA